MNVCESSSCFFSSSDGYVLTIILASSWYFSWAFIFIVTMLSTFSNTLLVFTSFSGAPDSIYPFFNYYMIIEYKYKKKLELHILTIWISIACSRKFKLFNLSKNKWLIFKNLTTSLKYMNLLFDMKIFVFVKT